MSTLRITILGCGSSGGVPRSTGDWGACDPNEPKNRRSRSGMLLQQWKGAAGEGVDATIVLIDTPPDLRLQLAQAKPDHLDAVVFSHDHADQTHGIDDVRAYFIKRGAPIPAYMDAATRKQIELRFGYCLSDGQGYPSILRLEPDIAPLAQFLIPGPGGVVEITPLDQDHGFSRSLGFRVGPFAYTNDVVSLPIQSLDVLRGLDLWIVDALRERPHPTHAHIARALDWIAELKPKHAVLTNLNHDVDYATLKARLDATMSGSVEPAYDGWIMDLTF